MPNPKESRVLRFDGVTVHHGDCREVMAEMENEDYLGLIEQRLSKPIQAVLL